MTELLHMELKGLPPTVNHLYRSTRGGRRYKTVMGRLYQDYVTLSLSTEWQGREPYTGRVELRITFTTSTRRRWDIDNRVKALQDCISLAGIIADDAQVDILHVERQRGKQATTYLEINALEQ